MIVVGVVGGLAAAGVFSSSSPADNVVPDAGPAASIISEVVPPDAAVRMTSPDGRVNVDLPASSVDRAMVLRYEEVTPEQAAVMLPGFESTGNMFDLTLTGEDGAPTGPVTLSKPIAITMVLGSDDIASAQGLASNLVIQHYLEESTGWTALTTDVDLLTSTARAQVDSLSIFALTVIRPAPSIASPDTPTPTPRWPPPIRRLLSLSHEVGERSKPSQ